MQNNYKIKQIEIFSELTNREIDEVYKKSFIKEHKKGERLFSPHDKCSTMGVVIDGSISFNRLTSNNKSIKIKQMGVGEIFGEIICLSMENYPNWIIAADDCNIMYIPNIVIEKLLNNSFFRISFFKMISEKSLNLVNRIELLSYNKIEKRVAFYLLDKKKIPSVTALSEIIGVSREALSRSLTKLKKSFDLSSKEDLEAILYE